jgi:hypothetical protein
MADDTTVRGSCESSRTIPVSCVPHRGSRGFAALVVEKRGEEIMLDVQVADRFMIIFDEAAATALFDVLGTWLSDDPGVQIG